MQYSTEFCHTRHCDRLRKELDNITTKNCPEQENTEQVICCVPEGTEPQDCTEEKTTFTLTEFKELVHSAQKGDREAINVLCTAFKPLIYKEAYRYEVREALGEDAVNTAWLIFLEQIKKYDGRDFGHLPGLLQYHIHYAGNLSRIAIIWTQRKKAKKHRLPKNLMLLLKWRTIRPCSLPSNVLQINSVILLTLCKNRI